MKCFRKVVWLKIIFGKYIEPSGNFRNILSLFVLKGKTSFGTPRNTQKRVEFYEGNGNQHRWACHITGLPDREIRLQSGSNKFDSQKVEKNA